VHLKTLLAVLSVITLIIFVFTFTETLRRMAGRSAISLEFLTTVSLYHLPYILVVLFPYVYLISISLALETLAASRQLIILHASGYSMRQVLSPFFYVAGILSLAWLFVFQPFAAHLYNEIQTKEQQHFGVPTHEGNNLWFYQRSPGEPSVLLHVDHMQNNVGMNVSVYLFSENGTLTERIFAKTLHFIPGAWKLSHVTAFKEDELEHKSFAEREIKNTLDADRMFSSLQPPEDLGFYDLFSIAKVRKKNHLYEKGHVLVLHALGAKTVLIFLMVFVAGCFQRKHSRVRKSIAIAQTLLCSLFLHFLMDIFHSLGIKGIILPFWAGWTSVLLTGAFACAYLSWKEER
jgi:lipopolysaccharide export system permease protein